MVVLGLSESPRGDIDAEFCKNNAGEPVQVEIQTIEEIEVKGKTTLKRSWHVVNAEIYVWSVPVVGPFSILWQWKSFLR